MKKLFLAPCLFALLLFSSNQLRSQHTLSGYVEDASSGERLIGATVFDELSSTGTVTNVYGFYSLTLQDSNAKIVSSYLGYNSLVKELSLQENIQMNFPLQSANVIDEIEIVGERFESIEEETQMSKIDVPIEQIKKLPALLGEVDVLKSLQLLPGVQSGGEGQTGLYVRGGSPDQNLVLLDGVPVYNVSHVLGIFSVFNADAIKNVTLTKGGFPARYGGRLSSVLEINMKDGNKKEFGGEGSIGIISSKLMVEGPIIKDKTSFILSGRRTYADIAARPFINLSNRGSDFNYNLKLYFYDLNAKINHTIDENNRIYLSFYSGSDVFGVTEKYPDSRFFGGIAWGNIIGSLRWNHQFTPKLFSNTTLIFSDYQINFDVEVEDTFNGITEAFSSRYFSGIQDFGAKVDFDYIPNPNHYIRFGASTTRHKYSPGALTLDLSFEDVNFDTLIGHSDIYSLEHDLYIEDDIQYGAFKANIGLHGNIFQTDEKVYTSIQPRIGLRYLLGNKTSLKASFSTMTQNINLLTSEALSLPTDLWVPSTKRIVPQQSWQIAAGAAKSFGDGYEVSLEAYYKEMNNVISFKPGASFLFDLNADWQDKVTQGFGESYGLELFLQKKKGKTTGWIGYTLAWNNRQFDEINGGEKFPFRYDRRHDFSAVVSHDLTERWSLSAAWIYGTGNAVTLPIYQYDIIDSRYSNWFNRNTIESLGSKNAFRMSSYHRLDLGAKFLGKQRKHFQHYWSMGIYNTYNHNNPYFILADSEAVYEDGELVGFKPVFKEISILPIIPSLSFGLKF